MFFFPKGKDSPALSAKFDSMFVVLCLTRQYVDSSSGYVIFASRL
jgi:hypothetical protein